MTTHSADEDQNFKCGWEYGANEALSSSTGLSLNLYNHFVQTNDPANPFSSISPAEMSTLVLQTIGTSMFTAPICISPKWEPIQMSINSAMDK